MESVCPSFSTMFGWRGASGEEKTFCIKKKTCHNCKTRDCAQFKSDVELFLFKVSLFFTGNKKQLKVPPVWHQRTNSILFHLILQRLFNLQLFLFPLVSLYENFMYIILSITLVFRDLTVIIGVRYARCCLCLWTKYKNCWSRDFLHSEHLIYSISCSINVT